MSQRRVECDERVHANVHRHHLLGDAAILLENGAGYRHPVLVDIGDLVWVGSEQTVGVSGVDPVAQDGRDSRRGGPEPEDGTVRLHEREAEPVTHLLWHVAHPPSFQAVPKTTRGSPTHKKTHPPKGFHQIGVGRPEKVSVRQEKRMAQPILPRNTIARWRVHHDIPPPDRVVWFGRADACFYRHAVRMYRTSDGDPVFLNAQGAITAPLAGALDDLQTWVVAVLPRLPNGCVMEAFFDVFVARSNGGGGRF